METIYDVADVPLYILCFPWYLKVHAQSNTHHHVESYHQSSTNELVGVVPPPLSSVQNPVSSLNTGWLRTDFPPSWIVIVHNVPRQYIG
jgi:hypothetical protein